MISCRISRAMFFGAQSSFFVLQVHRVLCSILSANCKEQFKQRGPQWSLSCHTHLHSVFGLFLTSSGKHPERSPMLNVNPTTLDSESLQAKQQLHPVMRMVSCCSSTQQ